MKAGILAGGLGRRMGAVTPKCLLTVGRLTVLDHTLCWLSNANLEDIVVVAGQPVVSVLGGMRNGLSHHHTIGQTAP